MSSSGGESGSDQSWKQMWRVFESLHREVCRCYSPPTPTPHPHLSAKQFCALFSEAARVLPEQQWWSAGFRDHKFAVNAAELR